MTESAPAPETKSTEPARDPSAGYSKGAQFLRRSRELIRSTQKEGLSIKTFNDYIIPVVILFVFFLIVIFVFVPFGSEIFKIKAESDRIRETIAQREEKLATLKKTDLGDLETKLEAVSKFIMDDMDVSALAKEVEKIATDTGVSSVDTSLSNNESLSVGILSSASTMRVPSYARMISGPFSFSGKFANIMLFLKRLRTSSTTLLSFRVVDLSTPPTKKTEDLWTVSLFIDGFLSPAVESVNVSDPLLQMPSDEVINQILQRVSEKEGGQTPGGGSTTPVETPTETPTDNSSGGTETGSGTETPGTF